MRPAVALASSPVEFSLIQSSKIRFRSLYNCDLPLLSTWLNRGFVSKWLGGHRLTYEEVEARYGPRIRGAVPIMPFLMLYDDLPIGYAETYDLADRPRYNRLVRAGSGTAGVDFFIGESDYLYGGFSTAMLSAFLDRVVFRNCGTERCIAGADVRNRDALRCYERAGFDFWKLINLPAKGRSICLMGIGRSALQ